MVIYVSYSVNNEAIMNPYYIPILQIKKGELDALSHLKSSTQKVIRPIFELPILTDDALRRSKKLRESNAPLMMHINSKVESVTNISGEIAFYFDIRGWASNATVESGEHVISHFSRRLTDNEVAVNPVINYNYWDDPDYQKAITSLPVTPKSHFLVRLSGDALEDIDDREYFLHRFNEILSALPTDSSPVAVQIDFSDVTHISPTEMQELTESVISTLSLYNLEFISLSGSSMPIFSSDMVKEENSAAIHLRREFNAWQALRTAYPSEKIILGDYGINNATIGGFPNPHANGKIRYTISSQFFIARGHSKLKGDGFAQFHRLSAIIMDSKYFMGTAFSWADHRIKECRDMITGPGSLTSWIAHDTNHHIEFVTTEIAEFNRLIAAKEAIKIKNPAS